MDDRPTCVGPNAGAKWAQASIMRFGRKWRSSSERIEAVSEVTSVSPSPNSGKRFAAIVVIAVAAQMGLSWEGNMSNAKTTKAVMSHPAMRALSAAICATIPLSIELADELWNMSDRLIPLVKDDMRIPKDGLLLTDKNVSNY
jgi:hypothetical protein